MAARDIARFQPEHAARNHAAPMQHDQAMHRPDELRVSIAPAHYLWNRQRLQRIRDQSGEDLIKEQPFNFHPGHDNFALGSLPAAETFGRNTVFLREPGNRLSRCADRRTVHFRFAILTDSLDFGDGNSEPTRRGKDLYAFGNTLLQLCPDQFIEQPILESLRKHPQGFRRKFLGEKLHQQSCPHHAALDRSIGKPSFSRDS